MDVGDLVGGRTPEGAGIDPDRDFVRWLKVLVGRGTPEGEDIGPGRDSIGRCCWFRERDGKPNARGRGYRSGQGLRRGIQLRFRKVAKTIAAGPELAVGSNSCPCRNNALSRNLSCITPPPQQPEPISSPSGWHFRPVGKNIKYVAGTEADAGRPVLGV